MRRTVFFNSAILCLLVLVASCKQKTVSDKLDKVVSAVSAQHDVRRDTLTSAVLTAEQQAKLTPQEVLEMLKKGNKDFTKDNLTIRNNTQRVRDAAIAQFPVAAILSCLDSRIPVEDVFHRGIGDVFVGRVAGNIVNEDLLGSLEFACKVSGAKVIVVLGHEHCGAIQAAIDNVQLGNITALLTKIQPAVQAASKAFVGERKSSNPEFVEAVCNHNVELAIKDIRAKSPILKGMEDKGELLIVGGVYDMTTGVVDFFSVK